MNRKTNLKIKPVRSQMELRKQTPSPLFRAALYRSGAGVHADAPGRYNKRDRARNRSDERAARLGQGDGA